MQKLFLAFWGGGSCTICSILATPHTHLFNSPLSRTTQVSRYQKVVRCWRGYLITTPAPHYSVFLQAGCPSCRPTNSVKALNATYWLHQQRPFNGLRSGTTRVGRYQRKHSPTHTHPDHRASFIIFLHLQRSMASSLFNLRA